MIDYHVNGAYGRGVGAQGFDGYIEYLRERQTRELRMLPTLHVEWLILVNPQRDWTTAREALDAYLSDQWE